MASPEGTAKYTHVHQTLEQIAFLLAMFFLDHGIIGFAVGGSAILLLVVNAFSRDLE